jgi:hypothetical protein
MDGPMADEYGLRRFSAAFPHTFRCGAADLQEFANDS